MKLKNSYFFTKREDSKDEESVSANLLVRSGMIKKAGSGINKKIAKISAIISSIFLNSIGNT